MEEALFRYVDDKRQEMLLFLRELVLIQSGSHNKAGVDRIARTIRSAVNPLPLSVTVLEQQRYGDILVISTEKAFDHGNILLVGHMDTAFPADSSFQWWREDEEHAFGPGVIDMKSGLVAGIYALRALQAGGMLSDLGLQFIVNSEEEVGSPVSRPVIAAAARQSTMAFVLECGGLQGQVVTGRKGRLGLKLLLQGRAGHAAQTETGKASAILALARKVVDLEALNGAMPGLTVNIGQVAGGTGPNTVPEKCWASIDVRFASPEALKFVCSRLEELCGRCDVPGTNCRLEKVSERPLMTAAPGNKDLFAVVAEQAAKLGVPVVEEFRVGASDANIIASEGTPVVDGLGPIGEHDHSDREYLIKESLFQRTKLLAASIRAAWQRYQAGSLFAH